LTDRHTAKVRADAYHDQPLASFIGRSVPVKGRQGFTDIGIPLAVINRIRKIIKQCGPCLCDGLRRATPNEDWLASPFNGYPRPQLYAGQIYGNR
jgi:hypothetical protein